MLHTLKSFSKQFYSTCFRNLTHSHIICLLETSHIPTSTHVVNVYRVCIASQNFTGFNIPYIYFVNQDVQIQSVS